MPGVTISPNLNGTQVVAVRYRENTITLPMSAPQMGDFVRLLLSLVDDDEVALVVDSAIPADPPRITWTASAVRLRIGNAVAELPARTYGVRLTGIDSGGVPFEIIHPRLPDSRLRMIVGDAVEVSA